MATPRMLYKVTVLGDGGVGKTALTVQFTMSSFVEHYDPTIEDCYRKQWVVDGQPCLLEVLDTAGQEEYTALRDQWIRDGEGFLIVYSITSRISFERVEKIVERVHRVKDDSSPIHSPVSATQARQFSPNHPYAPSSPTSAASSSRSRIPITIVGNKRDAAAARQVSTEEGKASASRLGCEFYEASAKTNSNVEVVFKSLIRQIRVGKKGYTGATGAGGAGDKRKRKKCVIL